MSGITPDPLLGKCGGLCDYGSITDEEFQANADLKEGVSGQATINTQYENVDTGYVQRPRSAGDE